MGWDTIKRDIDGAVATIRLDRPAKRNAMNRRMGAELAEALDLPQTVRAVVITGDERAFSAGADLAERLDGHAGPNPWLATLDQLAGLAVPTVAALSGYCLGGGLLVAICCDLRIASEDAVLGFPEIGRGFIPGGSASQRILRIVSPPRAKELMMLGEHVDAATALQWDLVNRVVPAGTVQAAAGEIARTLAAGPAAALHLAKRLVDEGVELPFEQGVRLEQELSEEMLHDAEITEGVNAFLERREPRFPERRQ